MKVCVFGAGSVGGHMAGRLAQNGAEVSLVVRGAHLAAIRERGLRVVAPDGTIEAKVAASADPADLGPQDAVVVSVKAPSLPSVAAAIRPLLGPDTAVAFVMNGIRGGISTGRAARMTARGWRGSTPATRSGRLSDRSGRSAA
ncbi:MAG: 2-dehydropantoate 2-reductase N-terminal domain-containing protein [Acetobacteraceae bacterium]